MKRSSPTVPDPDGGPPQHGCLYAARYFFLGLALVWIAAWFVMRDGRSAKWIRVAAGFSFPLGVVFLAPLVTFAERREIRRYCEKRGLKVLKFKWRGVIYMDGDLKRYSRWPDDFRSA